MFILKKLLNIFFSTSFTKIIFKLSSYFLVRKKIILFLFFLGILVVLLDLICASLLSILYIIQNKNTSVSIPFFSFLTSSFEQFTFTSIIFTIVGLQVLREILVFLNSFIPGFVTNVLERDVRNDLTRKFLNKSKKDLDGMNKNEIIFKLYNMTPAFASFISDFIKILTNSFIVILYLSSILIYKPIPSIVILFLLILVAIFTNKLILIQQKLGELYRNYTVKLHDRLNNTFNGISEIFINNKKKFFYLFNKKINAKIFEIGNQRIKYTTIISPVQRSMSILILGSLLAISEYLNNFGFEISSFHSSLIIIFLLFRVQTPVIEINNLRSALLKRQSFVDSLVNDVIYNEKKKHFLVQKRNFFLNEDIHFKKVNFSYDKIKVLKNLDFSIKTGMSCGIIGETGSGKSTLVNLLLKLYQPNSGKILIGNKDLKEFSDFDWRKNISIIPQKGYIFNSTIKNNISMFHENVKENLVIEAAKVSGIAEHIESLPKKYNTNIGGKEIQLSGGQIQKILIARAVYNKPKILILDEATSAQDAISEEKIITKIKNNFPNITIIILTHRLSILKKVETIYCLKKGEIVDSGSWSKLHKNKNSMFRKMLNLQVKTK